MEIVMDCNEHTNKKLVKKLEAFGLFIIPEDLDVGDFFIPPWIIERKEYSDFISSSKNHGGLRVMPQLRKMKKYTQSGYKCILLIEGDESVAINNKVARTGISKPAAFNQMQGLKLSVAADFGMPVIHTPNMDATVYIIRRFAEKASSSSKKAIPIRSSVPASRPMKEKARYLLEGLPYTGPKTADVIMEDYKTLEEFVADCIESPNKKRRKINRKVPHEVKSIFQHKW